MDFNYRNNRMPAFTIGYIALSLEKSETCFQLYIYKSCICSLKCKKDKYHCYFTNGVWFGTRYIFQWGLRIFSVFSMLPIQSTE